MNITLTTIPHKEQRYETVGDWVTNNGTLESIFVSDMGNEDYAFLVGVHELVEGYLCTKKGVTQEQVDEFDRIFEEERGKNIHEADDEPGNDPRAPYKEEHYFATEIERMLAEKLGVDWATYGATVLKVGNQTETTMSDENKTDEGNGGESETQEQSNQPEGVAPVPEGSNDQDAKHEETGTPSSVGEGTKQDEV